jgi:hypothetical protein
MIPAATTNIPLTAQYNSAAVRVQRFADLACRRIESIEEIPAVRV